MDKLQVLKSISIFSGLNETILRELSLKVSDVKFSADKEIFKEGDVSDSLYIIADGEVTIYKNTGTGKEKTLAILGSGNVFGEMALFSELPRTANSRANADVSLLKLDRKPFLEIIQRHPSEGLKSFSKLLEVIMLRLEDTSKELATIFQTGKTISSGKDISAIAADVKDEVMLSVPEADTLNLFLYNEFNRDFTAVPEDPLLKEIDADNPLIKSIKENPTGIFVNDTTLLKPAAECISIFKSAVITPIIKSGFLLGFFILGNKSQKNAFKNSHSLLLLSVASQLAEAVENIKFQQEQRDRKRLQEAKGIY